MLATEYRSLEDARDSIARWIAEYNHDRPHSGVQDRTPHEAFVAFAADLKNEAVNAYTSREPYDGAHCAHACVRNWSASV